MKSKQDQVVVIYSGGMDSFTLLHRCLQAGYDVRAVNFNYGQKHVIETTKAKQVCEDMGVRLKCVNISALQVLISNSALTGSIPVPKGHYEDESMKLTVVPNRNMMMISMAAAYAINIGADRVFYGAHAGDHAIYPDCRREFVEAMQAVLGACHYEPIYLTAPYLDRSKGEILSEGLQLVGLDAYTDTWTCYDPQIGALSGGTNVKACGKCGSCTERLEAFAENGVEDPIPYVGA